MNAPATTMNSNATMNPPPVARNQEKNDAMSAAAAVALTGLQSVSTAGTSTDGSSNSNKSGGKKTRKTGNKDEAVALEVSKTFPQIVSNARLSLRRRYNFSEARVRFFAKFIHGPAQALFSMHFRHVMCCQSIPAPQVSILTSCHHTHDNYTRISNK